MTIQIITTQPEGNAYGIMGKVIRVLQDLGKSQVEIDLVLEQMKSGDYDNLCDVAEKVTEGEIEIVRDH